MRRSVVVYNPMSGRQITRRLLPAVVAELEAGGFAPRPAPTGRRGDATRIARQAAAEGCEVVFAMGGDGTLREVAAGLLGTESALGVLPAGTANVLSLAFGLPRDARAAARLLPRCRRRAVDVGLAGGEPFLMMASCGLDAEVMAHQNARWKRLLGPFAVIAAALGRLLTYPYPDVELRADGVELRASFAVASNIPFYGGRFRMAPAADFRDGRLDLVTFHGRGARATAAFAVDVLRGRHLERADVEVRAVEEVEILGPATVPLQIDGDVLGASPPLKIALAPRRLQVLLP